MTTIRITPQSHSYGSSARDLLEERRGELRRSIFFPRSKNVWRHDKFGWIRWRSLKTGVAIGEIHGNYDDDDAKLLGAIVGFIHRYLRDDIVSVVIPYIEETHPPNLTPHPDARGTSRKSRAPKRRAGGRERRGLD